MRDFDCGHEQTELRGNTCSNGVMQYSRQCLRCGCTVGNYVKHDTIKDKTIIPSWDKDLQDRWYTRRSQTYQEKRNDRLRDNWHSWYQQYLTTDRWLEKRQMVLTRCNGVCEGCQMLPAREVHHLTYENVGNELLFQLVGLCSHCHARVHGNEAELDF